MTIICYRDGVMAADSHAQKSTSTITGTNRKIVKMPCGGVVGACGLSVDCAAFLRWCAAGRPDDARPSSSDITAIVIEANGEARIYEGLNWFAQEAPFHAVGCGSDLAIGAMAYGASAIRAVEIAIQWHGGCGGEIHVERFGAAG